MPLIRGDEYCELCCGTGWQIEPPVVLGQEDDGSDILSEQRVSMCRCGVVVDPDEDEDYDMDDDSDDDPVFGSALVLA